MRQDEQGGYFLFLEKSPMGMELNDLFFKALTRFGLLFKLKLYYMALMQEEGGLPWPLMLLK